MMQSQLASDRLRESLKRLHDLEDHASAQRERILYSRSVLNHSFVDSYAKQELSLIFNAQLGSKSDMEGRRLESSPCAPMVDDAMLILKFDAANIAVGSKRNQEAMFVSLVENVNFPNGKIPSTVRA